MSHTCHWKGCGKIVPASLWGCARHWYMLPVALREEIRRTYRPGQEIDKRPSAEYIAAAIAVRDWIAQWREARKSDCAG